MRADALNPYELALDGVDGGRGVLGLHAEDGDLGPLDLARWLGPADDADHTVLARCGAHVLDLGCGPGRFVNALAERGVAVLGLDIAAAAVALTCTRGGTALRRDLFGPVPGEGRWSTALLMDGNLGIGGNPDRLLHRVRQLLAADGEVLVEVDPADVDEVSWVRFSVGGVPVGPPFQWARLGLAALTRRATRAGLRVTGTWTAGGRRFVALVGRP